MNKSSGLLLMVLLMLTSCTGKNLSLPNLTPAPNKSVNCSPIFPQGHYQFVHLINFTMPGGNHGTAMGVTVTDGDTIESVLMTVEGFVLFSARFADKLNVERAVPPFDKPGFASGMMRDIQDIFLRPQGKTLSGSIPGSPSICRIVDNNNRTIDIIPADDRCRRYNIYTPDGFPNKRISGNDCSVDLTGTLIPKTLKLTSWETGGYTLHLTLISAEML